MVYQVLARKYRPRSFSEVVGQSSILRALTNALKYQRIHHAYLFSGTHGIGKTSLARLLAKCLNCSTHLSTEPCGTCDVCVAFDQGRFVDLVEIDAASRTKIEDTRELLDHVQYAPTMGRYKVYLIDEVHMLSMHSFNALLKTLEEPPPHTVFLLATTELQRLPATVVSRCLQFHLKKLSSEQIVAQFVHILEKERIRYEMPALDRLAQAAQGSLRDGLSLLDQAIQYSEDHVLETEVNQFLGTTQEEDRLVLVKAMVSHDANTLIAKIAQLAEKVIDFNQILEDLLVDFHHIALYQMAPTSIIKQLSASWIEQAKQLSQEEVQLYYQIALIGKRDLPLAPTPRLGFEMLMLRMMAFRPNSLSADRLRKEYGAKNRGLQPAWQNAGQEAERILGVHEHRSPSATTSVGTRHPFAEGLAASASPTIDNASNLTVNELPFNWEEVVKQLGIQGITKSLALHCVPESYHASELCLLLDPRYSALHTQKQENYLQEAVSRYFNKSIQLRIHIGNSEIMTPAQKATYEHQKRLHAMQQKVTQDQVVQALEQKFNATIQPDSLQLIGDTL